MQLDDVLPGVDGDVAPGPGAPPPRVEAASPTETQDGPSSTQIAGVVLAGGGAATLGVATVLGLLAAGASGDSDDACAPFEDGRGGTASEYRACTTTRADAAGLADASTVVFLAGAALAGVGLTLVVLGGDAPSDVARLAVAPGVGGVAAWGAF